MIRFYTSKELEAKFGNRFYLSSLFRTDSQILNYIAKLVAQKD